MLASKMIVDEFAMTNIILCYFPYDQEIPYFPIGVRIYIGKIINRSYQNPIWEV